MCVAAPKGESPSTSPCVPSSEGTELFSAEGKNIIPTLHNEIANPSMVSLPPTVYKQLEEEAKRRGISSTIAEAKSRFSPEEIQYYLSDPTRYAQEILKVSWWSKQIEVVNALITYKKVAWRACHGVGKSHLCGGLVNYVFDMFRPSRTITTAPSQDQVDDVVWAEVRKQRRGRGGFLPKASRLQYDGDEEKDHYAVGYTAASEFSFQGRHSERGLLLFDEASGIHPQFFNAGYGIISGGEWWWLCIYNPLDVSCHMWQEEHNGSWHIITCSALEHPNILASLAGVPEPFPGAVSLKWVLEMIENECIPITPNERRPVDFEFPQGSGKWYRPSPIAEGKMLGRWPSVSTNAVWNEPAFEWAITHQLPLPDAPTELGCDVARHGDDYTSIVGGRKNTATHHETHNGWDTEETASHLKLLVKQLAQKGEDPRKIAIKVDDTGVGGGVTDQLKGYNVIPINSQKKPPKGLEDDYPNIRSWLWFNAASRADNFLLDLTRLSRKSKDLLRLQVMMPVWKQDSAGRRVVEPKPDTKKRLKRSPDDADALNLFLARKLRPKLELT